MKVAEEIDLSTYKIAHESTFLSENVIFYSLENDHVRQLVIDAVFNAEHAGPGVPSHHRGEARLTAVAGSTSPEPPKKPRHS